MVDDERAIGSDFKRVEYTATDVTDKTLNKGLTYIADLDNVSGPNWQNEKIGKLLRRLFRNEYRRGLTAINTAATNSAVTWMSPPARIRTRTSRPTSSPPPRPPGIRPDRVLYGDTA